MVRTRVAPEQVRDEPKSRKAAMYLRMSTDHQRYSTENQEQAIRAYADRQGFDIIETYTDGGRSGLVLAGREALQRLIADVQSGQAAFRHILVYDVSRWGRFQDADESAYYEYACRRVGIQVIYCAEQFENDGSPIATIVKGVKRAMAGEFSRELSVKVFAGQCRLVELGFRQGGSAGYGLRRVLIDPSGAIKATLRRGEHKSLQTDRVILVPGPAEEIEVVHRIYRWFISGIGESTIAARLLREEIPAEEGSTWTRIIVHNILTNEKYLGRNVFNRRSFKLQKVRIANPPEMWIRKDDAFDGIVPRELFDAAQTAMQRRYMHLTDEDMLDRLRALLRSKGYLSAIIINETEDMPSAQTYAYRFGGLERVYKMIGFETVQDLGYVQINRHLRELHPKIVEETERKIEAIGGAVRRTHDGQLLEINGEITASVVLARCMPLTHGMRRWRIRFLHDPSPDITVAVRLNVDNEAVLDYYLLPRLDFACPRLHVGEWNAIEIESYRFDTLDYFYGMASRTHIRRAA